MVSWWFLSIQNIFLDFIGINSDVQLLLSRTATAAESSDAKPSVQKRCVCNTTFHSRIMKEYFKADWVTMAPPAGVREKPTWS